MSMTDIVRDFKKMYYTTDDYNSLLNAANWVISKEYPSLSTSAATSGVGGWPTGRKRLTKKKNSQVSKKRKTRKHSQP
jgi:hypothetical protein